MISQDRLIATINRLRDNSIGDEDNTLSSERADALKRYKGEPYGDEQPGRSQVVSKDVAEAVDYILPVALKTFLASGNVVEFTPEGPEDEPLAEQESDYVNHIMLQQNDAFVYLHDWFKDALITRNGYIKHFWEESEKVTIERYAELTEDELARVVEREDEDVEIIEQEERELEIITEEGVISQTVYDVKLRVKCKDGKICIHAVPPSEVRIDRRLRGSIQEANYFEHCPRGVTRTDLIEMGMDKDFVYSLPAFNEDDDNDEEEDARDTIDDQYDTVTSADSSMDEIQYREVYIRVDADEDGKAELRKVVITGSEIPPGDEWNQEVDAIPFTYLTPKRIPHRHIGESLYDDLKDIQRIKTTLQRQTLDNVYMVNNSELILNERATAYLDDYLERTPGGIKRVEGMDPVGGSVQAIATPPILGDILPAIDYFDNVREARTGIGRNNAQMDPDVLRESTKGAYLEAMKSANAKVEMVVRMFAEIGVKELAKQVHKLAMQYQDKGKIVRLRNQYVTIDPSEWKDRDDLIVKVGLGTGNAEEQIAYLQSAMQMMEKLAQFGMVGPQQAFNVSSDLLEKMGFPNPQRYVMDPQSPEFQQMMQAKQQPPQPSPDTLALVQVENQKSQAKMQEAQMKAQLDQAKMQLDGQLKMQRERVRAEIDRAKLALEAAKHGDDKALREAELELKAVIEGLDRQAYDLGQPGYGY